jgi:hypothetical protein
MGMPSIIEDEYDGTTISQKKVSNAPKGELIHFTWEDSVTYSFSVPPSLWTKQGRSFPVV